MSDNGLGDDSLPDLDDLMGLGADDWIKPKESIAGPSTAPSVKSVANPPADADTSKPSIRDWERSERSKNEEIIGELFSGMGFDPNGSTDDGAIDDSDDADVSDGSGFDVDRGFDVDGDWDHDGNSEDEDVVSNNSSYSASPYSFSPDAGNEDGDEEVGSGAGRRVDEPRTSSQTFFEDSENVLEDDENLDEDFDEDDESFDEDFERFLEERRRGDEPRNPFENPFEDVDEDGEDGDEESGSGGASSAWGQSEDSTDVDAESASDDPNGKTSDDNLSKKPSADEARESWADRLKRKFGDFKTQAAAELRGEDAPKSSSSGSGKELALRNNKDGRADGADESDGADGDVDKNEDGDSKAVARRAPHGKDKSPNKNFVQKLFAPFWKLYLSIVDIVFRVIDGVLKVLGKIPVLGAPFRFLRQFTQPLKIVATSLPLLLVLALLVFLNMSAVKGSVVTDLPDRGKVVFSEFKYDPSTGVATGTLKNDGEVIAEGFPTFTFHSMQFSWNPVSWVMPKQQQTCSAPFVRVDIDGTKSVTANCDKNIRGIELRVSGEFK